MRYLILAAALSLLAACERTPTDTEPDTQARWTAVATGTYFSCGLTTDRVPSCWGFFSAAPGNGGQFAITGVPVPVPGAPALDSISTGGGFACGLNAAGAAYCWGEEFQGELGNGGGMSDSTRTPVPVAGGLRFTQISAGYNTVCALTSAGQAYCWGSNGTAQLGNGTIGGQHNRAAPTPVSGSVRFTQISVGTTQTCGLTSDGRAYCWGGGYGSTGVVAPDSAFCQGTSCWYRTPQPVSGNLRFRSISAGNGFTCAVATDGAGWCWGAMFSPETRYGMLGNGSTAGSETPVRVAGGLTFTMIETGTRGACGLTTDGAAHCWGGNSGGELGIGRVDDQPHPTPEPVTRGLRFRTLSLAEVSCGIATDDRLYCWGLTAAGMVGNGDTEPHVRAVPTRVHDPRG